MILLWCIPCAGDSSEEEEEEGESGGGDDDTTIICGLGVKMRVIKDGKYRSVNMQLTHYITHKPSLLSTYVGPLSGRDVTWRFLRGINIPGWSLQTRLELSHPGWMEKIEKTEDSCERVINKKIVNDGTGTEPYWITLLTDDYNAYMHVHVRTESWRALNIWKHTQAFVR